LYVATNGLTNALLTSNIDGHVFSKTWCMVHDVPPHCIRPLVDLWYCCQGIWI